MLHSFFRLINIRKYIQIYAVFVLFVFSSSCAKVWHLSDTSTTAYTIKAPIEQQSDSLIQAMISPYKVQLDDKMNEVIGLLENDLRKARPESGLGNWVSDMIHIHTERHSGEAIDFAAVNYGGLRVPSIPAGPLKVGQIFELMPFDNELLILKVNGTIVQQFFEKMAERGGWPISHTVSYQINEGTPVNIQINGAAIDPARIYKIALSDFIANGGDKCFFFVDQARDQLNILFRDAMLDFIRAETAAGRKLEAKVEGRVTKMAGNN